MAEADQPHGDGKGSGSGLITGDKIAQYVA